MPREFGEAVIDRAAFGVLAVAGDQPYCVPLSFVRDGDRLYFHGALEGRKVRALARDPRVCVSFVGSVFAPPDDFTMAYESATVFGTVSEITDRDGKIRALEKLCRRFTPDHLPAFGEAVEKAVDITGVWEIRIDGISAKRRRTPGRPG